MLHGRRLDLALEHVDGSRYALVHAVSKRARQITLWLTSDPAELRTETAPPPVTGENTSRDPVALSESEILDGEVVVRWDPDGLLDDDEVASDVDSDALLLESLDSDDDDELSGDVEDVTPALAQAMASKDSEGDDDAKAEQPEGTEENPVEVSLDEINEAKAEQEDEDEDN